MSNKKTMWMSAMVIAASVCVVAILGAANQASAPTAAPEKETREAVAQFYKALNVLFTGDMKPMNDDSHCSTKPVRFVLEMNQGWFAKRNIQAGFKLTGPVFSK